MKTQFAILLIGCTVCGGAFGASVEWWTKNTICQINNSLCYDGKTPGVDFSLETGWDISGDCRGKKYICGAALGGDGMSEPVAMERVDISRRTGISPDFDTDVYVASQRCYGARKTQQNGAKVSVNGDYVNVWCNGILSNPTDTVANGEITTGVEPTCQELADMNYVATLNGNCYGKKYDDAKYAIDCDGENPVIVVLNGAQYNPDVGNFITTFMANARFGVMQNSAATQRAIHFNRQ